MKADKYGTAVEQRRFDAGWMPAKQRTDERIRKCINCAQAEIPEDEQGLPQRTGLRCQEWEFATRDGAICKSYQLKR
jgi:hypothetical protein